MNKKNITIISFIIIALIGGLFFILRKKTTTIFSAFKTEQKSEQTAQQKEQAPQKQKLATPDIVKGIYLTSWSSGLDSRINYVIELKKTVGVNAVVIDIKDYSGFISYDSKISDVEKYKAKEIRVKDLGAVIDKLHQNNIYTIARITAFQDPVIAMARPELAVHDKTKGSINSKNSVWKDKKGLSWIDPASKQYWEYLISISKEASSLGFDELNFDYVRFPSDGKLSNMIYPNWDGKTPKNEVLKDFFKYLRENLSNEKISADLFGLTTTVNNGNDMEIGQIIGDAYQYFDFVSPMIYPSHYPRGFNGYKNPADHPYEIISFALKGAQKKLDEKKIEINGATTSSTPSINQNIKLAKIRPWLQDFNLGATYDTSMVKAQIKATQDALGQNYNGFLMWAPSNNYTKDAF